MPAISDDPASVASCLRIGVGFDSGEHAHVIEHLSSLDKRLRTFPAASTELELTTKDRDRPGQTTTLECWVAGRARVVGTSSEADIDKALVEVRDHVRRQLDEAKTRREPQNYRHGHDTVRTMQQE